MGKGTSLSVEQVRKLVESDEKGKKNLKKVLDGDLMVYCPAVRKKVKLPKEGVKFEKYNSRGRVVVRVYGHPKGCVSKDGKQATAGTFIANLPGSGSAAREHGKSVKRRSKSAKKSVKRRSKSRKSAKKSKKRRSKSRKA